MSCSRGAAIAIVAIVTLIGPATSVSGQSDTAQAPFQVGPGGFTPTIRLSSVGWDSNVYNLNKESDPPSDFTAALSPIIDIGIRSPRLVLSAHSQWDYYHFQRQSALRALDIDQSARVEANLNRLQPFVNGSWMTTRHRQNLEIDAFAQRRNQSVEGGTYVRLSAKTAIGVYGGRAEVDYDSGEFFRDIELAPVLNHSSVYGGLGFRYQATPLTTFALNVTRGQDRFDSSRERNSDSWRITPSVEFKPLALISGTASVGFQRVTFSDPDQPEFKSSVAAVDLTYTLLGRTQFTVGVQRRLEYSYLRTQLDYVLAGASISVAHRLNDRWDLDATVSRYGLGYRRREPGLLRELPRETYMSYGTGIGYRFGKHRVAFDTDYSDRSAEVVAHEYDRLRIGSSFTYAF